VYLSENYSKCGPFSFQEKMRRLGTFIQIFIFIFNNVILVIFEFVVELAIHGDEENEINFEQIVRMSTHVLSLVSLV